MATPYWQLRRDEVPSTQDLARAELGDIPAVVIAAAQTEGRGRSGTGWLTAPRALAVSVAYRGTVEEARPISLMAGVAARRALGDIVDLKWPNDLEIGESKVGGILVEQTDDVVVVGMGLNLWWPDPAEGIGALYDDDPGAERHAEIGALWAAELLSLLRIDGWPIDEYRQACVTLGRDISWEPDGSGRALDISESGALVIEDDSGLHEIHSGAVRHVRG
jgi:BirA family biotin operon repressor/biotin-[acetyl-CoA-carboxylase] ligase